jgi:hypothetical protein
MGCRERPYDPRYEYTAFVDPSGGHKENKTSVLDVIREVPPPFSPEGVVVKFAALLIAGFTAYDPGAGSFF